MAEVPLPTPTDNPAPSTDIRDAVYAGAMLDKVVTSTEHKYTDRLGGEHYTVDGIKAEGDKVVEETRQNLIPLSRQYMTLEAAQADIANIPAGSATYVRSTDGSSLADEYINNAGTLQPTGRKMPSQETINAVFDFISKFIVSGDVSDNYFPFFTDGADNVPVWWDDGFAVSRISLALYQMIYDDVHSRLGDALNSKIDDVSNAFFPLFIDANNNV
ncbi:SGNH/GDSL hydrolase family protein, partial [Klebsiella grimontii]|nr:SGNH/GDSL hydrolase family protein [Klebsiella grimontii]